MGLIAGARPVNGQVEVAADPPRSWRVGDGQHAVECDAGVAGRFVVLDLLIVKPTRVASSFWLCPAAMRAWISASGRPVSERNSTSRKCPVDFGATA